MRAEPRNFRRVVSTLPTNGPARGPGRCLAETVLDSPLPARCMLYRRVCPSSVGGVVWTSHTPDDASTASLNCCFAAAYALFALWLARWLRPGIIGLRGDLLHLLDLRFADDFFVFFGVFH